MLNKISTFNTTEYTTDGLYTFYVFFYNSELLYGQILSDNECKSTTQALGTPSLYTGTGMCGAIYCLWVQSMGAILFLST